MMRFWLKMLGGLAAFAAAVSPAAAAELWVGQDAPEFSIDEMLQAPPGVDPSLEMLDGEVIVLEFIELDCEKCQESLGHFNELIEKFKGKPVRFIALSTSEIPEIREFLKEHEINTWVGSDPDWSMWKDYNVRGVPMTVVINGAGRVAAIAHPKDVTEEVLNTTLLGRTPRVPLPPVLFSSGDAAEPEPMVKIEIRPADLHTPTVELKGETYHGRGVPLRTLIDHASGVPAWRMTSDDFLLDARYDVDIEPPFPDEALTERLLAGMVELMFRPRLRQMPQAPVWMYEMHVAQDEELGLKPSKAKAPKIPKNDPGHLVAVSWPVGQIQENLRREFLMPVVDETGLEGRWDFTLQWEPGNRDSLFKALREQLGIELRLVRRPMKRVYKIEKAEPGDDLLRN